VSRGKPPVVNCACLPTVLGYKLYRHS